MGHKDFIENIFQRATEEFDIEFNPAAWQRMEQKLNRARRRRVFFYWLKWSGLFLISLIVGWLLWQQFTAVTSKPKLAKPSAPIAAESAQTAEEYYPDNQAITNNTGAWSSPPADKYTKSSSKEPLQERDHNNHLTFLNHHSKNASNSKWHPNLNLPELPMKNNVAPSDSAYNKTGEGSSVFIATATAPIAGIAFNELKSKTEEEASILLPQTLADSSDLPPTKRLLQQRWTIGLSVMPQTSSVGFRDRADPGFSFGLLTEYRFAQRFSLGVEGVYSKKHYVAGTGEFYPPRGYWSYGIAPIETAGNCNMLEATLSLRTELFQGQRWKLVANTGVSTWWMLREEYYYEYETHAPGLVYNWESRQTTTQWLAIGQCSLGSELKISPKLSAQAAIFLQIPLQGVGSGKVQLYSQGLSLSLRHHF